MSGNQRMNSTTDIGHTKQSNADLGTELHPELVSATPLINDFVLCFANVNGTGSASANTMVARAIFRMGVPIVAKNLFPSNIQGLPTWYEIRVSEKGYLGRRHGIDLMIALNPQSFDRDMASVMPGGVFVYDSTKVIPREKLRNDVLIIGIPMMRICMEAYSDPRQRLLFKNMIYVGALTRLLDIDPEVMRTVIADEFKKKPKLIEPNVQALELGMRFIEENYSYPINRRVEKRDLIGDRIFMGGNDACGLGAVYAGATVAAWYPITPSTSLVSAFEKYANRLRREEETKAKTFAVLQAEDEISAIGMVLGAMWNGARAFTATSGPGISLMSEFLGLSYFAEIPAVLVDVQRVGPSTGMPTRTQQSDILLCANASHGDTKHVLLFPATPTEGFHMMSDAFDLAERLQTAIIVMSDLDLGMNEHLTEALHMDPAKELDRGKVLSADDLDTMKSFGRYLDVDGDGVPYRTIPALHPTRGSFFTRGSSHDEYARYTEDPAAYVRNMERLEKKWNYAKTIVPKPIVYPPASGRPADIGLLFFGSSLHPTLEAIDMLEADGLSVEALRIRAFPFTQEVVDFVQKHERVLVVEQNRDAQMRSLLMTECDINASKLIKILNYDGMPATAVAIRSLIRNALQMG